MKQQILIWIVLAVALICFGYTAYLVGEVKAQPQIEAANWKTMADYVSGELQWRQQATGVLNQLLQAQKK